MLLLTFFVGLATACSKHAQARIGGLTRPEIGRFRWLSMIMCTLLAGGGVFFAWFIGYTPLMAVFVSRISRGRTVRETILAVAVLAPIATTIWFTLLGGSGIYHQMAGTFDLTEALNNFRFDVTTLTVAQALPGGTWMAAAILLLTTIFVATTGDSMSYSIAMVGAGHDEPSKWIRVFWGGAMALMAAILLYMGAGQIGVLQQFIVITAIPVSLVILPSLWTGPQAARASSRVFFCPDQ
jgi:choline-glycine betaine transporter